MSDSTTRRMIEAYIQQAAVTMFFAGMFRSPAENFYTSEEVEIDIERSEEDVSIVVTDLSTGYRMNSDDIYTNKSFKPPIHKEAGAINAFDLIKREVGQNPFESPDYRANLILRIFKRMRKVEQKIRRAIELQASQVLQTGIITLTDENGVALYSLDFKPKATHFPDSVTAWGQTNDTKLSDILGLTGVIRADGLLDPDMLIFGENAWNEWIQDSTIQNLLDNRRINIGDIGRPTMQGSGGTFHGMIAIGSYNYEMWTYTGRYKDPQSGASTRYMDTDKVIVKSSQSRLDATFGAIPNIGNLLGAGASQILPELPGRVSSEAGGMDLFTNAWLSNDGEQLIAGVGARPLMIPTAIDTYGCLNTNP